MLPVPAKTSYTRAAFDARREHIEKRLFDPVGNGPGCVAFGRQQLSPAEFTGDDAAWVQM